MYWKTPGLTYRCNDVQTKPSFEVICGYCVRFHHKSIVFIYERRTKGNTNVTNEKEINGDVHVKHIAAHSSNAIPTGSEIKETIKTTAMNKSHNV